MTIRATLIALIGSIAFGPAAGAQTEQPQQLVGLATRYVDPVAGVGIERAITQALEQEPSLRAARSEVNVARGMRVQAGLRPNPSMTFSQQQEPTGRGNQTRIEFVWPLDLFRKASRVSVAERQIDATRSAVGDEERLLAADVRMHYGNVAAAVRELTVLDDVFDAVSGQLVLVTARVDVGATPPLERDLLSVELQRLESERLVQAGVAARAMVGLKRIMGMAADAPLAIRDGLEDLVDRETGAQLPADSAARIQRRSDVEAALARERVAEAQVEQARQEGRVDVSLFGMYMRTHTGFPLRAFNVADTLVPIRRNAHNVAAGASVIVPFRNRNQGAVAAARARKDVMSARLDATRLTAQAEVASARARDEHARQAVAVYTSFGRALARQNLTVVSQTYELGRATVFDVLAEQRRYLEVERAFTNALREAYEARQELRRALGEVR
jgi:cobalt-zinc-cadmium efflux system outer membrane protein